MSASAILKLQQVGFTSEQVAALAEFMDTQAASKSDLNDLEHRLGTQITELRSELKSDIAQVDSNLKLLEQRMTIKLGSMMFVAVGAVAALVRLL